MTIRLKMPPLPLTGGCQCGAVRYTLHAAPVVFYICHCTECQKQASSGFGESLRIRTDSLEVIGETKSWTRPMPDGRDVEGHFCAECGARLFHRRAQYAELMNIKAGTLDDTSWLVPAGHIWTRSKQPWVEIPDDAISHAAQPADYEEMMARWREMMEV